MKQIATALVKAQSEMVTPKKANVNPFYKNKYADINSILDAIVPTLNANGIVVLQPHVHVDGKNFVKTILLHESGESLEGFTEIIYSKTNDAQAQGSGITYARRYGLQSMVSVGADDDDGQKASQVPAQPAQSETTNEPAEWLNLFDKQGNKTDAFISLDLAINGGKKFTLVGIRKSYKVSKEVAEQLKEHFNIV